MDTLARTVKQFLDHRLAILNILKYELKRFHHESML